MPKPHACRTSNCSLLKGLRGLRSADELLSWAVMEAIAMNTAVLVIDVQQGLCEGEGAAFDCEGTIRRINAVPRKARHAGAPVMFIQHESNSGYLEYGSAAWQLANGLEVD